MMLASLLAGLLTLHGCDASAADVTVRRSRESQETIAKIIIQTFAGAVGDVGAELGGFDLGKLSSAVAAADPTLKIDGQPRTGIFAWLAALWRVCGYAIDTQRAGSICYDYRLRIRGYDVRRRTEIANGYVLLTTSTGWTEVVHIGQLTRRIPIHVTIRIDATETGDSTRLVGTATGRAGLSDFRCGIVRSIAGNRAEAELRDGLTGALATVERTGRGYYAGGSDIVSVLDRLRAGIDLGREAGR